jgi:predicted anti-sigma-YlaC factor YlaD
MTLVYGPSCDRTRALISRQLDTPLSELERRAVAIHTARCAACRAFECQSRWITDELRAAPCEPLLRPVTITTPRRRLPMRVVANVASAAALVAVALGGVAHVAQPGEQPSAAQALPAPGTLDMRVGDPVLREIRRAGLRTGEIKVLPPAQQSGVKPALPATDS